MRIIRILLLFVLCGICNYAGHVNYSVTDSKTISISDILYETGSISKAEGDVQIPFKIDNSSQVKTNSLQNRWKSLLVSLSVFHSEYSLNFYNLYGSHGVLRYDYAPYYLVYRNLLI